MHIFFPTRRAEFRPLSLHYLILPGTSRDVVIPIAKYPMLFYLKFSDATNDNIYLLLRAFDTQPYPTVFDRDEYEHTFPMPHQVLAIELHYSFEASVLIM